MIKKQINGKWQCGSCKQWKKPLDFHKNKSKRNGLHSLCKKCISLRQKEWWLNISNKARRDRREYYRKQQSKLTRGQRTVRHLKEKGIIANPKDLDMLYLKQNGKCAICGKKILKKGNGCHLDHNHKTKKIRGWLCKDCNLGLGRFKDSSNFLRKAIKYLEAFRSEKARAEGE